MDEKKDKSPSDEQEQIVNVGLLKAHKSLLEPSPPQVRSRRSLRLDTAANTGRPPTQQPKSADDLSDREDDQGDTEWILASPKKRKPRKEKMTTENDAKAILCSSAEQTG